MGHAPLGTGVPLSSLEESEKELSPRAVLILDDEPSICLLLAEMLQSTGHPVLTAGSVEEAMSHLRMHSVAVVVVDVQLAGADGIAFLQQALDIDNRLLGIVMTGHGNIELAVRAMKSGAADFLTKPFQVELVRRSVSRLLELYRLRQENTVLTRTLIRSGNIQLRTVPLADFSRGNRPFGMNDEAEFERGVSEGEKRVSAARQREQTLMTSLMARLEESWRSLHETVEEEVVSLAFMIAGKVLREVMADKREVIVTQVRTALAHLHESGLVRVRMHPSDLPILESARAALSQTPHGLLTLKFETDPAITPGGCLVQAQSLLIDATLDTQLLRLGDALRKRDTGEA